MNESTTAATDIKDGALYKALTGFLPTFTKDPFSAEPDLNVQRLKEATGKSHEAIYKWLRSSKLTPTNAKLLVDLANSEENTRVLAALQRKPPTFRDFDAFVYA